MESVKSLNYSARALEQFTQSISTIRKDMPGIRNAFLTVVSLLQESVKFILPNHADLIDMEDLRQVHVDMARLPFPVVALEAPWVHPDGGGGDKSGRVRSSKRIALCMTLTVELAERIPELAEFINEEHGGAVVIPLYWDDGDSRWIMPMGGVFVPYQNEVSAYVPGEASVGARMIMDRYVQSGVPAHKLRQFRAAAFVLLPEMFEHMVAGRSRTELYAQIAADTQDEVFMLLQTGVMLNCANVTVPEIAAPAMLNKKRIAKGKQPFFSYRILQIEAPRSSASALVGGGHHATPRAHLRRGHIRRLDERTIWVRPAMVNAGTGAAIGKVEKDYAINSPDKS
ncbi:hypothetical protein NPS29_02955 [Pseudomonas putida]|uniref:hypothetical protein n=1 Tax=Pseudomonas putida TaxID=303 RepID=UPI0023642782|nr:hypothetical protein [Pseudomonas putida]MDD1964266.1 hypothetical protein [Pseudomonas putida]